MNDSVLVIGGGGREHALAWKLAESPQVKSVYVAPGNAGTIKCGKISNVALNIKDFPAVIQWCKNQDVSMVVVGPEDPLALGICDELSGAGVKCFGPSAKAAQIEASKDFAKKFMERHSIPTACYRSFQDADSACEHINRCEYNALVVKASGLAAGKGVVVSSGNEAACHTVQQMMKEKTYGTAGDTVIIEELLEGDEVSVLAFTDGTTVALMPPSQDHKRLLDGDHGPNTGGMGAYCPYPKLSKDDMKKIERDIVQKTVDGMRAEGMPYVGVLYVGLMLTKDGPKVLEFNCRFGDPETQVILPLLKSDLYSICKACIMGSLKCNMPRFDNNHTALGVVLVSGGYPGPYTKGLPITGVSDAEKVGLTVVHAGTRLSGDQIVTSGGRVLAVVAVDTDLLSASSRALKGAAIVQFDQAFYRKDIGNRIHERTSGLSYKEAGVDVSAGNALVEAIKPLTKSTCRPGCNAALGMFGAIFDVKAAGFKDPLLISGTDGVGTKLKIAHAAGNHKTIGIDLVAMCVNDILAHGAEPLFFLDYFACGKLNVAMMTDIIAGVAEGCRQAGCALVGGETAEMPGMYMNSEYDLAGFAVGAVEREQLLPRSSNIHVGDAVIGIASSGLHSNGYSLVRKLKEKLKLSYDMPSPFTHGKTLGEELLTPTIIYVQSVISLMRNNLVKGFAHITGGGLAENVPRILPEGTAVTLDANSWKVHAVFGWLAHKGNISETEMSRTFNCGIGGVLIVDRSEADEVVKRIESAGQTAGVIGLVTAANGSNRVIINNLGSALSRSWNAPSVITRRKRVGVLLSGSGTNLQALIDYTRDDSNHSNADIVLVISNKPGVQGLKRAQMANIPTKVINHKDFSNREAFDMAVDEQLRAADIEIICLAGFMRILSGPFVRKWTGRLLNVHPSLLPSFKGGNAHRLVLQAKVRITGCSVHFVAEEVDAGAILVQESVPVYPNDTEETLSERVKKVEHIAYPKALELVASEKATLMDDGDVKWTL